MKSALSGLLAATLVALTDSNQGNPGGQRVTTNPPHKPPAYGEADNTFKLSMPRTSTTPHQRKTKDVSIGIERGTNFDGDLTLEFAGGPQGVTLASANPVIKHGDTEAKVTLKAQDDASLGDFTIKVTGGTRRKVLPPRAC